MAFRDSERKLLCKLARHNETGHPVLARDLLEILGLSGQLKQRIAAMSRYTTPGSRQSAEEVTALRHHILLLVKSGLRLVELRIMPFADQGQFGSTLQVYSVKLRATFYHVLCRFHNQALPVSPRQSQHLSTPPKTSKPGTQAPKSHTPFLVPPSPEVTTSTTTTDISFISNPWAQPPPAPQQALSSFSASLQTLSPYTAAQHSDFILPKHNYLPRTNTLFLAALSMSSANQLPKSAPLRLAILLEYCEFLLHCCRDEAKCRSLARQTVQEAYAEKEGIDDADFEDAKDLVAALSALRGEPQRQEEGESTVAESKTQEVASALEGTSETGSTPLRPSTRGKG